MVQVKGFIVEGKGFAA